VRTGRPRACVQAVRVLGKSHQFSCPRGDLNTQTGAISLGSGKQLDAPYTQAVDDDLLVIEISWPGTTIDGDPASCPECYR
jgi:hypothetical protein